MTLQGSINAQSSKVCLTDEQQTLLAELADDSEYWKKAHDFFKQVEGRELSSLTDKQENWYINIEASINRENDLREAMIAFGLSTTRRR